jgi:hypothetical protein
MNYFVPGDSVTYVDDSPNLKATVDCRGLLTIGQTYTVEDVVKSGSGTVGLVLLGVELPAPMMGVRAERFELVGRGLG